MLVAMNQNRTFPLVIVIIYFHNGWGNVSEKAAVTSQLLSCKAKRLWQLCCSLRLQT